MSQILLDGVGKSYGSVNVLRDISLTIDDGEFVVLVGPSGCGKSTLLRMIAGLEDISEGNLIIDGKVANAIPAKKRDLAMVFQSYALYPHMNVADNMSFSLKLARIPKPEIKSRVEAAANILGLSDLLLRTPRELSGGQRQRVAMGRAIVRDPQAFLFDEPLSNLDAKLRVKMRSEIKKLHKRLGRTMVYVTHDQTEAMTMADKVVVLNDGNIAQAGPPLDVYRNPANIFVASFIGSPEINLIPATVKSAGSMSVTGSGGVELPLAKSLDLPAGAAVIYGIRPQHIAFSNSGLEASVLLDEPTGEVHNLIVKAGELELSVVCSQDQSVVAGEVIKLEVNASKAIIFDQDTGMNIS